MKSSAPIKKSVAGSLTGLLLLSLVFSFPLKANASEFIAGTGTADDPYRIGDCIMLQDIASHLSSHFVLYNDIDCTDTPNWNSNTGFAPMGAYPNGFSGVLDGQGFRINGLTINAPNASNGIGLFGYVSSGAIVKNVEFTNTDITGQNGVGIVAGTFTEGTINNVSVTNSTIRGTGAVGSVVGGLQVNYQSDGSYNVDHVSVDSSTKVYGATNIGGLFGTTYGPGTISNVYSRANIYSTSANGSNVGGLIGKVFTGGGQNSDHSVDISNAYSTGNIEPDPSGEGDAFTSNTGGLVGEFDVGATGTGSISNSFSTAVITATGTVGALVGSFQVNTPSSTFLQSGYYDSTVNDGLSCVSGGSQFDCNDSSDPNGLNHDHTLWYNTSGVPPMENWDFTSHWVTKVGDYPSFGVDSCDKFSDINSGLSGTYKLGIDLDCSAHGNDISVGSPSPYAPFTGIFYGDGHTITVNITYMQDFVGLFRSVNGAVINDLHLKGSVSGGTSTGGIAGQVANGTSMSRVVNSASIWADSGTYGFGGIAGIIDSSAIIDSYNDGNVTTLPNQQQAGGIAGQVTNSIIARTYSRGKINGGNSANIGGLFGMTNSESPGSIIDNFSVGKVAGSGLVGGITGQIPGADLSGYSSNYWDTARSNQASCATDNNINPIASTPESCEGVSALSDGNYTDPLYFKNNTTNGPLSSWSFYSDINTHGTWDKVVDGYPALHSILDDGQAVNDDAPPAPGNFKVTVEGTGNALLQDARVEVECPNSTSWSLFGTTNSDGVIDANLHSVVSSCQSGDQNIKFRVYKLAYQTSVSTMTAAYYSDIDPNDSSTGHDGSTNTYTVNLTAVTNKPNTGSGTAEDPYIIHSCAELVLINYDLGAHYKMDTIGIGNAIGCNNEEFPLARVMNGNSLDPDFTGFFGTLDGSGSAIKFNLQHIPTSNKTKYLGLFGFLNGGTVIDLQVGVNITDEMSGDSDVGALAGLGENSTLNNVTSSTNINYSGSEEDTGDISSVGFIGYNGGTQTNTLTNSSFTGTLIHLSPVSLIAPKWNSVYHQQFSNSLSLAGWTDLAGVWSGEGGTLNGTSGNINYAQNGEAPGNLLIRDSSENALDQRIKVTLAPTNDYGIEAVGAVLRYQDNSNFYLAHINDSNLYIYHVVNGDAGEPITTETFSTILGSTDTYSLDFSATGGSPTFVQAHLKDETTGKVITTAAAFDSTNALQSSGQYGLTVWNIGEGTPTASVSEIQTFVGGDYTIAGDGSSDTPYLISSCEDLQSITNDIYAENTEGKYYKLGSNINCSGVDFLPLGFDMENTFNGNFNGDGHDLEELNIGTPNFSFVGLFSSVDGASVTNFNLTHMVGGLHIYGQNNVGAVAGKLNNSTVSKVKSDASVTGTGLNIGGIVGSADNGSVLKKDASTGDVRGYGSVGGLIGIDQNSTDIGINQSYASGNVTGLGDNEAAGGLVGYAYNLNINDSYATGNVTGSIDDDFSNVGGLVGYMGSSSVNNTYATGNVTGFSSVGGLIGYDNDDNDEDDVGDFVHNNFATGTITTGATFNYQTAGGLFGTVDEPATINPAGNYFLAANSGPGQYCVANYSTDSSSWVNVNIHDCNSVSHASSFYGSSNPPTHNNWNFGADSQSTWEAHSDSYPTLWAFHVGDQVDNQPPIISDVAATPDTNSVQIGWTTDEISSSKVQYSLTPDLNQQTSETNTNPRVTTHTITINNLIACTGYYFKVISTDAFSNTAQSSRSNFLTTGCNNSGGGGIVGGGFIGSSGGGGSPNGGGTSGSGGSSNSGNGTGNASVGTDEPFRDEIGHWSHDFVLQLYKAGVVTGREPGLYVPEGTLTRAEAVKIGLLAFGYKTDITSPSGFSDLDAKAWYVPYLRKAKTLGVISGTKFHPNDPIIRADALVLFLKLAKKMDPKSPAAPFSDVSQSSAYAPFVNYAYAQKVVEGRTVTNKDGSTSKVFAPLSTITRAEIAKIVFLIEAIK